MRLDVRTRINQANIMETTTHRGISVGEDHEGERNLVHTVWELYKAQTARTR